MAIEDFDQVTIAPAKLRPFSKFIMSIGELPTSYLDSLTYAEQVTWFCDYLQNNVIPALNNNAEALEEVQRLMTQLQEYVDNYFTNLDVQEEINNKLDQMAEDGSLTNLIKNYIDPIVTTQNNRITQVENTVNSVASGSPAGVYSTVSDLTTADPNHNKIYLVLANGKWYYYDSTESAWTAGGVYQATPTTYDVTLTQNNATPNSKSVGDKLNNLVYTKNLLNPTECLDNKIYFSNGTLNDNTSFFVSNIIKVKNGDTIIAQYYDNTDNTSKKRSINSIVKVQADGTFISLTSNSDAPYWTADADCFIRLNLPKTTALSTMSRNVITLNTPTNSLTSYSYNLIPQNEELDQISEYVNVFNINDYTTNGSIDVHGNMVNADHYFTTNLIPMKTGDIAYTKYHDDNVTNVKISNVFKYDENMQIIGRSAVNNTSYTATGNGYVKFTCANPNDSILDNKFTISINKQLSSYVPYKRYIIPNDDSGIVSIKKVDSTNYNITFGKFKCTLFKTVDESSNSNNWNIKNIRDINDNIIVPQGTDILGPVKINNNSDFIGGIHGDETTNYITVSINGTTYDLENINAMDGDTITITIKSTCYDQDLQDTAFHRYITLIFSDNKIHIWNNYKAAKNLTLKRATNGGLIAAKNNIIKDIMLNTYYFATPPTSSQNIGSKYNTNATINTIYGSITVNNIKGYTNENYNGFLTTFTNEDPIRNKIYFDTYKEGNYSLSSGDVIIGEFEYLLS